MLRLSWPALALAVKAVTKLEISNSKATVVGPNAMLGLDLSFSIQVIGVELVEQYRFLLKRY